MAESETTELDRAHAAMEAAPADDAARLRFYERLAESELSILIAAGAGDTVEPALFETAEGSYVLAFDRPERLAAFTGAASETATLSGRMLAQMLAGQGVGLALNPEVAPSAILLPAGAMDWLAGTLAQGPSEAAEGIAELRPPGGLPPELLPALDRKLATARGLARAAWLAGVRYSGGGQGHLLAVIGAVPGSEPSLAAAVGEALTFSGLEAGALDVVFLEEGHRLIGPLERHGMRFDLPQPEARRAPRAPGSDPEKPPRLR